MPADHPPTAQLVRERADFLAAPVGKCVIGPTYMIWCEAPDLAGSIQWGTPNDQDVRDMIAIMDFIRHPDLAASGCVLMDCREIERVDSDVLLGFLALARDKLPLWSPRIRRQAVVVPGGVAGMLLAGALPLLAPSHAFRFVEDLDAAFAFLEHPGAPAAQAAAAVLASQARGSSALLGRLRTQLARDLVGVTIESCAAALGQSVRSLQRELGRLTTSFSDELRRARVGAAEELLRLSDLKIEAIASRVGFGTASRMSAALRRELGVTASELRARTRR